MNWLLHNVVADLYGPYFLAFYALTIGAVVVACYKSVRGVDRTQGMEPPDIPAKLDPYEVAYLRGGANEVTRVAIASLIQRGLLRITDEKRWSGTIKKIGRGRNPQAGKLTTVESAVMQWSGFPAQPAEIFQQGGIPSLLEKPCAAYEIDLTEKELLAPKEMKDYGIWLGGIAATIIVALGGYKFAVALMKGHTNLVFLGIMCLAGLFAVAASCMVLPRLSHVGKAYLEQLKLAFAGWKDVASENGQFALALDLPSKPPEAGPVKANAAYSDFMVMLGVFGVASLANTPHADVKAMFARGGSSHGCGAGGCGGGACGGGGCGGGGCGGCGG
jgi:uncharacterized protein (TIGR04222 family)